jgi:formate dehydrogenase major subunit
MTNHWIDLRNSDVHMVCGSNPAETFPVSWKWVEDSRDKRGAKVIVVDPRFTRSAAKSDVFSYIRPGTDIAFFGALIKYAIDKNYINWDSVQNYTNAPILVNGDFKGPGQLVGLFSGYNKDTGKYDTKTWTYQADAAGEPQRIQLIPIAEDPLYKGRGTPNGPKDANGNYIPNDDAAIAASVFGQLKLHYSRYTYEGADSIVAKVCGMDPAKFKEIAETYVGITHKPDKVGNLQYAMGLAQFTMGVEKIRAFAILQSLLGNVGLPGGGINALRGESNVQGSTDFALLSHLINGYISVPNSTAHPNLGAYMADPAIVPKAGYWANTNKFVKSYLMAYWGPYAKKEGLDKAYDLHPKVKKGYNYTHIGLFEDMNKGIIKGLVSWGQNPPVGGPNANLESNAMDQLDWYVAVDLWDTEAMNFWQRPGIKPKDIKTAVWALPAASSLEKSGSIMHSGRVAQYRWKAVELPGDAKSDGWMLHQLMVALKAMYKSEGGPTKEAITELFWDYDEEHGGDPNMDQVQLEINGFNWPSGEFSWEEAFKKPVFGFGNLKDDMSTACGNWVFSGQWASDDDIKGIAKYLSINDVPDKIPRDKEATEWNGIPFNKAQWHYQKTPIYWLDKSNNTIYTENPPEKATAINLGIYPNWAWGWPMNRRIIYNRCSCDYSGKPFAPDRALFTFKPDGSLAMKNDVNDFYLPADLTGKQSLLNYSGANPYIMNKEQGALVSRLFSNTLAEGPFPEHYEPRESPVHNVLSGQQYNPAIVAAWPSAKDDPEKYGFADVGDSRYPYVGTTYRVTEHWQAGQMTRNLSWLGEAMPEMFVEISKELADELKIKKGDTVEVESLRGKVRGIAVVTVRLKPLTVGDGNGGGDKTIHVVGLPWHFGYIGMYPGGSERGGLVGSSFAANQLTPHVGDPNITIPEYKAFLVNVKKVK